MTDRGAGVVFFQVQVLQLKVQMSRTYPNDCMEKKNKTFITELWGNIILPNSLVHSSSVTTENDIVSI